MAIKTACSSEYKIKEIIEEIKQEDVKVILFFFSPSYEENEPQKAFASAFPDAACIGSSMIGGWSNHGSLENGIIAMSLSADEVDDVFVSFQEGVKEDPVESAKNAISELKQKTKGEKLNPDEYLGLIFFDGLCLGELIMKEFSLDQDLNMAFVGGAAADILNFTKTLVSVGSKLSGDALAAVILKMKIPFFFNHYVHYLPTETSFTITRVETMKRIAWEINGEPAAVFYAKQIGLDDITKLDAGVFAKHPLGLKIGNSVYVRSPNAVIEGKGLQFYCYIEAGTRVNLLKQGDIIGHAEKSLMGVSQFLPGIKGCLLFNCVLRYLELKELDKLDAFNNVFSAFPMIGFNTYGEELFTHHNQTLTAVFFGSSPEEGTTDPYKTKRLFHYTDSKLKSLVFDIVSRSELLNITISYLKGSLDADSGKLESSDNFETIKKSIRAMVDQSNVSKEDIEKMLVVYQNNVEKTGEYVFNIVDEIREQNRRLMELKVAAETASLTKSNFLANMSHEIRTPMNAITGMAELLLRENLTNESRSYVQDIKHAAGNLISIINDLLDFSKIEAGKLELINGTYLLSSLINDVVSIIRARIMEKPIRFFTNIDSNIPHSLIGDEVRIRQVLLNLLSNAVKYTHKGHIGIFVSQLKKDDNSIWLKISVIDTGIGIKPEDQAKLFSEFIQVDTKRNRSIEGTGLGLSIVKKLCIAMGGDIIVESEYGKGSDFTVFIPQEIDSFLPFAAVENKNDINVIVFERRSVYTESLSWTLENLDVKFTMADNEKSLEETILKEKFTHFFSGYGLYERIKHIMERPDSDFPGGQKPHFTLMLEWGSETYVPNARFMSLPIQALSIANVLNGKNDNINYFDSSESMGQIRFIIPHARLLVVDDIATNLKVAEGLLAPYNAKIDTCLSGIEAIELVKRNRYDLVFMDHMMPEMDGIEATAAIREWEEELENQGVTKFDLPIIALTANAVSGMKEMFLEKGFNDFLAKPIDISKLDEILTLWISKSKREYGLAEILENDEEKNRSMEMEEVKKLIILVDDNPTNLRIGKNALADKYTVATSPSAAKMFSLLENNHPDLILLDVDMPEMDGYEAIKVLKSKEETKDIPVIFLTGLSESCDEEKGRSLGAAGYFTKPFEPEKLIENIEKCIGK